MSDQTEIGGTFTGKPDDPTGRGCDWCPDPAKYAVEMKKKLTGYKGSVGRGMYLYACANHHDTALRSARPPTLQKDVPTPRKKGRGG